MSTERRYKEETTMLEHVLRFSIRNRWLVLLLTAVGALFYGIALLAISGTWRGRLLSLSRQLRKSPI